ncbi:MAG: hypothetical protein ABSC87_08965 [Halobacteriota archaeon]|jgi:hypothetical protein
MCREHTSKLLVVKLTLFSTYRSFVDSLAIPLSSVLGKAPGVPRTSVLGHMHVVAILAYLLSRELDAYSKRCVNLMNSDFGV